MKQKAYIFPFFISALRRYARDPAQIFFCRIDFRLFVYGTFHSLVNLAVLEFIAAFAALTPVQ